MTAVLVLDVDGVMVGFDPLPEDIDALPYGQWGTALDVLAALRGLQESVEIVWLTTWFDFAARHFDPYIVPATVLGDEGRSDRGWWKATALVRFLEERPDVDSVAWCDDHLRRYHQRREMVRTYCAKRGVRLRDVCPNRSTGLTMEDIDEIVSFFARDTSGQ